MKKLYDYIDFGRFAQGKEFVITSSRYNEKKGCVALYVAVTKDSSGENLYEKFLVYCVQDTSENAVDKYPVGAKVQFTKVGKCAVWGDTFSADMAVEAIIEVIK